MAKGTSSMQPPSHDHSVTAALVDRWCKDKKDVIICGAGTIGQAVFLTLKARGLIARCFVDNNCTLAGTTCQNISILLPEQARTVYPDAIFLIASVAWEPIAAKLHLLGIEQPYDPSSLLDSFDWRKHSWKQSNPIIERAFALYRFVTEQWHHPEHSYIKSVDAVLTERCSLKCRDCANLMQYYQKALHCDQTQLYQAMDSLLGAVDQLFEIRLLGGESFLLKNFHEYVSHFLSYTNCHYLIVYTNGTILPTNENIDCLENPRILVEISDYGDLSRSLPMLRQAFEERGILYKVTRFTDWQDCGTLHRRVREKEGHQRIFENCCAHDTYTLLHGRLYHCPFSAHAHRLGVITPGQDEMIDLCQSGTDEMRDILNRFFRRDTYLHACTFCGGRDYGKVSIPAAIQAHAPLPLIHKDSDNHGNENES